MSDSLLSQLQLAANKAMQSQTREEGIKHLANAFFLFSKETKRIQTAYQSLQERFKSVNVELEKSNLQLREKLLELKTISVYLDNILTNIKEGILFITEDGHITTINDKAKEILQIEKQDLLYKNYSHHFKDDFFGFSMKQALKFGFSQKIHIVSFIFGSVQKEVEVSSSFVNESKNNSFKGLIIMLTDVSEKQKLLKIANRNDRLKQLGEMAATVAHEIRNPLGGIRGYASLLKNNLEGFPHLQEMAKNILDGTKSLERVLSQVLNFAKPINCQIEFVDIAKIIKELLKFIKVDPSFPKNIQLELHISKDPFIIPMDKHLIRSALLNLLVNAYQAIEKEGKIILSLIQNNQSCMLSISDNGKGIHPKDLENIFSPFFTTKQKGTGLGLSETFKIIQAHLGTIDVHSQIEGTTFTITLPIKR